MVEGNSNRILTINSGSSSIKFGLYRMGRGETEVLTGSIGGIGGKSGSFHAKDADGRAMIERRLKSRDHGVALNEIIK
jgi:acetate kinase